MVINSYKVIRASITKTSDKEGFSRLYSVGRKYQPNLTDSEIEIQFQIFISHYIVAVFREAISKQIVSAEKMKDVYYPLSNKYKNKKGKNKNRFYVNTGWLKNNIRSWRVGDTVFVGFPNNVKHPTGVGAQKLLEYLDGGTLKMVARPLLSVIISDIVENFEKYVALYDKSVSKVLHYR